MYSHSRKYLDKEGVAIFFGETVLSWKGNKCLY